MTQHRTREEQIHALASNLAGVRCIGAFELESAERQIRDVENRVRAELHAEIDARVTSIVREVAELPDRTSPCGHPDMMLVSTTELTMIVRSTFSPETPPLEAPDSLDLSYQRGVQNGREAGITIGRHQAQAVIAAAINLAWSEEGTASILNGKDLAAFDPWPEMDALLTALDQARPGWRSQLADIICASIADAMEQEGHGDADG